MKILISSDHGGYNLKQQLIDWLQQANPELQVEDLGPEAEQPDDDYPPFAFALAEKVVQAQDAETLGILICRSGNGMAIAANKVVGARAALCFSEQHASKAREHDHANILVLDADYNDLELHQKIVTSFLNSNPEVGGRHQRRVDQIISYEQTYG